MDRCGICLNVWGGCVNMHNHSVFNFSIKNYRRNVMHTYICVCAAKFEKIAIADTDSAHNNGLITTVVVVIVPLAMPM